MKKKIRILSLCFVLLAAVTVFAVTPFAFAEGEGNSKVTVVDASGNPVTDVALPQGEKVTLTANAELTGDVQYQWQILADADSDLWVNISGENAKTIEASYAMVCSVLKDNETALRCVATGDESATGSAVKVTVTEPQKATPAKASAAKANDAEVATLADEGESGDDVRDTYNIVINYVFEDGSLAANPWTAIIAKGSSFAKTVTSPAVIGYEPDRATVELNIDAANGDITETVTYKPALVDFTVKHYQQNIDDDNYTLAYTETKQGFTKSKVGDNLNKNYDGFYDLPYDSTLDIAADGSTVVEIYYDRYYYLMNFNLDGGYGVEPIYARYGSPVSVGTPTKPGFEFSGWSTEIPATMPVNGGTYTANWNPTGVGFSVVFWYENADDNDYSYVSSIKENAQAGSSVKSADYQKTDFTGRDAAHFTYNSAKSETITVKGDGSSVLNVYFTRNTYTLTFNANRNAVATITAKYNEKISDEFSKAPFNTTYNGRAWECTDTSKYSYALQTLDRMPGFDATFNLYKKNSATKKTIYYYVQKVGTTVDSNRWPTSNTNFDLLKQVDTYFNFATYEEEYHEIEGFTRYAKNISFNETYGSGWDARSNIKNFKNNRLELYYMRNSYTLSFYNYNDTVAGRGGPVQYEAPLGDYDFTPDYPADLEPNAYEFAGWYQNPECTGAEYVLNDHTMPASNLTLYSKWVPVTHEVTTWLTDAMEDPVNVGDSNVQEIPHNEKATAPDESNLKNGNYKFVGWFYKDDNGEEKAFSFEMPITKDLELYAKWSADVLVPYTIHYQLANGTPIADDTTGQAMALKSKTFYAKTGTDLYEGYQSGYFPNTNSHSITMDIEGENVFTFIYVPKTKVNYTVRYLEEGTNEVLHTAKTDSTSAAVITEKFELVTGYRPDAYQKRLVLSANEKENELIFWYVKDEVHAPVQIFHWTQNIAGENYTEYQSSTNIDGVIGQQYNESPLDIPGFTYKADKSESSGTLTANGLVLNLYYDRIEYPYEFKFLEQGTNKVLAESITDSARYQAQVVQRAKDIPGYTLTSSREQAINIAIEDPANVANKNVRVFYYQENDVTINYVVPNAYKSMGAVNPGSETIKAVNGTPNGSVPGPNSGYKFVGWFTNEACTQPVDDSWVTDNRLVPGKENIGTTDNPVNGYKAATYYAKFEADVVDLTIKKTGSQDIDENQSFIFHVSGDVEANANLPKAKAIEMDVIVYGNGETTVKSLPAGTYLVTEMNKDNNGWSWRYTANNNQQTITPVPGSNSNVLNFANTRDNSKWLNGSNFAKNLFNTNLDGKDYMRFGECVGVWSHSCNNKKSSN